MPFICTFLTETYPDMAEGHAFSAPSVGNCHDQKSLATSAYIGVRIASYRRSAIISAILTCHSENGQPHGVRQKDDDHEHQEPANIDWGQHALWQKPF